MKSRTYMLIIIVLVIMNLVLLSALWIRGAQPLKQDIRKRMEDRRSSMNHSPQRPGQGMMANREHMMLPQVERFIVQQLNFSDEQKAQLRELNQRNQAQMMQHHVKMMEFKAALLSMSALDGGEENQTILMDSIATYVKKNERLILNHFRQVRELCDENQISGFDMALLNASARMRNEARKRGKSPQENAKQRPQKAEERG